MRYRWKPSRQAINDYKNKMDEIDSFCDEKNIIQSSTGDSYYFRIDGQKYRISNHTITASNKGAYNSQGQQVREKYHSEDDDMINIYAGKTRIIEIYSALEQGKKLNGKGQEIRE